MPAVGKANFGERALVTGGGGFLGKAITKQLLQLGIKVRIFCRGSYPELDRMGVETRNGDISDAGAVRDACKGCDIVFHVAALPGVWGAYEVYYNTNYKGTENVIAACRFHKIPRLVFTSSPSVVFDGKDMEGADESVPYPDHYEAHYPATKAMAEKAVLAANDDKLSTVSLRPHLIWGPGDNHLVPRIIKRGKAGQLKFVGNGQNKIDTVYIDNAADAHILAAQCLSPGSAPAGKAYFITQNDPRTMADFINSILKSARVAPVTSSVPPALAYYVGWGLEIWGNLSGSRDEPRMTRFLAKELATAHWFNISASKKDFGYEPKVKFEEGMERLAKWLEINPV